MFALCFLAVLAGAAPAAAIPVFAHRYGFTCQQCHSTVPQLNPFGEAFLAAGYRLPRRSEAHAVPVAVKVQLAYSSAADPSGLPKAVVDEIELLTGGSIGPALSYFTEAYVLDGGRPGLPRDVWLQLDNPRAHERGATFRLKGGQFTLPLPVEPETFRETLAHYALFDQSVGANQFNLFAPRIGLDASLAARDGETTIHALALQAHDRQSGLPARGLDTMLYAERSAGPATFSAYRYDGRRPLGTVADRFWRQGYGLGLQAGHARLTTVLQTGNDTSIDGLGLGQRSSGGFSELRWALSPRFTALARYDGTFDDSGMARSLTLSAVARVRRNSKFTLEDSIARGAHTLNAGLLFAY